MRFNRIISQVNVKTTTVTSQRRKPTQQQKIKRNNIASVCVFNRLVAQYSAYYIGGENNVPPICLFMKSTVDLMTSCCQMNDLNLNRIAKAFADELQTMSLHVRLHVFCSADNFATASVSFASNW